MYVCIYIYIYLLCVCIYGLSATSTLLKLSDTIRIAQLPRDELHAIASHTAVVKSSVWGKLKPSRCRKIYSNIRAKCNSIYIYIHILVTCLSKTTGFYRKGPPVLLKVAYNNNRWIADGYIVAVNPIQAMAGETHLGGTKLWTLAKQS